ncbi:MAG: LysR family transcriptional regulator [Thermodesulfobacteriota bacterium]
MELDQLRAFTAICEEKTVTRAAARLNTTPPSLSVKIKALEDELGVVLFRRTTRGMELTGAGTILLPEAERILTAVENLRGTAALIRKRPRGILAIGLNASADFLRLGRLSEGIQRAGEGIELKFEHSVSGRIIKGLESRTLDAGFIFGPAPGPHILIRRLTTASLVVCAPRRWENKIADGKWETLARLPWLHSESVCPFEEITDRLFEEKGLTRVKSVQTNDDAVKLDLIASGVGLALLEESEAQKGVEKGAVIIWPTDPIGCDLSLALLAGRAEEPLLKILLTEAEDSWRDG